MADNSEFKRHFAELLKKAGDKSDQVVRKVAIELQNSMILKSAVDTGRFRANWTCGIGSIDSSISNKTDKSGSATLNQTIGVLQGWKPGKTINLTNSLPYARRLEYGWSKQSPQGMVRLTIQEYTKHLEKVVAELQ